MKAFSGYEPKRSYVREQLPAGGYVVKIKIGRAHV